jgi:hypothetical protein
MSRRKERRKGGVTWDSAVLACGFTKTNAEFCNVAMSTVLILMMPMRDIAVYGMKDVAIFMTKRSPAFLPAFSFG